MPSGIKPSIITLKEINSAIHGKNQLYAFKLTAYENAKKVNHDALPREGVSTTSCKNIVYGKPACWYFRLHHVFRKCD
jgi:hypothetical protein